MKTSLTWSDKVQDREGVRQPIWDISFHPNGNEVLVAAGAEVLVYNPVEGELLQSLKAHKDTVYCMDYSLDGTFFATGSADKQVIIWNNSKVGVLKYNHSDPIQSISYNPVSGSILSCTVNDFGIWSNVQKTVTKFKVDARILSSSWTKDGLYFAIGLFNGQISIRDNKGVENLIINRGDSPIWSLSWNPDPDLEIDTLAIADWNQRLSFFQIDGKQVGKDRNLGFDPCSVSYSSNGKNIVIGGSDKKVTLWTSEGIRISEVCEKEGWIWSCKMKKDSNFVGVGCQDGTISIYHINFSTIHGLYKDRYAFRENMTDVVIQHLVTDQRARIKCRDHINKISVYFERLAIQLSDRVIIYELFHDDVSDMHYRIKEKIPKKFDCNLLVVTSNHLILCNDHALQMYNFYGEKEREWVVDAMIRYIKVIGGPVGREGLLVGLNDGQILQIFIDNPFPIPLLKQTTSIRCLDISMNKSKLAVVDEHNTCMIYDLATAELIHQEPNAMSVSWNSDMEEMFCYSGNGFLNIKCGQFPSQQQKMQGFVVGFKGSRIYCLQSKNMITVDIAHSVTMDRYLEIKDYTNAYSVACLGVTEGDWKRLAFEALEGMNFTVSQKAFTRIRDLKYIDLVHNFDVLNSEEFNTEEMKLNEIEERLGDVMAVAGNYHEAAELYVKVGKQQKAIEMFTDLDMWEEAHRLAEEAHADPTTILKKKAKMHRDRNDLVEAANTYIEVGDYLQAIDILGPNKYLDKLMEVARKLSKNETKALSRCIYYFRSNNNDAYTAECLIKLGDIQYLLNFFIELQQWEDAFKLTQTHPELEVQIHLPYGNWLASNDRFIEAQSSFQKAGRLDQAARVVQQLTTNSLIERRYDDGAFYYWMLSKQSLDNLPSNVELKKLDKAQRKTLEEFNHCYQLSEVYYSYHFIQRYIDEPFTSHVPESLFSMCLFLLTYLNKNPAPVGISKVYILFALTKLARSLKAFKTSRYAYEKLSQCILPGEWIDLIEVGALTIRSQPNTDTKDLMPLCYGCGSLSPIVGNSTTQIFGHCVNCLEPFVHSFYSFEKLPLVQFTVDSSISPEQAIKFINSPSSSSIMQEQLKSSKKGDDFGKMVSTAADPFNRALVGIEKGINSKMKYSPVKLNEQQLKAVEGHTVYVKRWNKLCVPVQYYKVIQPPGTSQDDITALRLCSTCNHFFLEDEWCFQVLQKGACPFCRTPQSLV